MRDLHVLHELSILLLSTRKLKTVYHAILTGVTAGRAYGFNRAFLLLVNRKTGCLEGRLAVGPASKDDADRIWSSLESDPRSITELVESRISNPLVDYELNQLVRQISIPVVDVLPLLIAPMMERRAIYVEDAEHDRRINPSLFQPLGLRGYLLVPMLIQDRPLGLVIADNPYLKRTIDDDVIRNLELFVNLGSLAIEQVQLRRRLELNLRKLEQQNKLMRDNQLISLQLERLATVGEVTAKIVHEIKNPLAAVGGFARILQRSKNLSESETEYASIIWSEVQRLEGLLKEILLLSRPPSAERSATDMNEILHAVCVSLKPIGRASRVKMREKYVTLPPVAVNGAQMRQVFLNLIKNAIEASASSGRVEIGTDISEQYVEVQVRDSGCGIPSDIQAKIFDPFFTTKSGGSGLGLAVVRQIVTEHGGSIDFDSSPQQGTLFRVRLPYQPAERIRAGAEPEEVSLGLS